MILVAGAGGFLGGHLVARLLDDGHAVRAVDIKPVEEWHQRHRDAQNRVADLRVHRECERAMVGADGVYNLACDMGGMGFIEGNKAACMLSVLINTNLLRAASDRVTAHVGSFLFTSTACVYPQHLQDRSDGAPLMERDAYPADPEDGYGWEKLFGERMCRHFTEDFGLSTRVARLHSCYGPYGTWQGGREKVPAAICRKVAEAAVTGDHRLEVWGDGEQTRSFMYVDDGVEGLVRLMASDVPFPVNVGSAEVVTINELVDVVEEIAGVRCVRTHVEGPLGVRGRSSDNRLIRAALGWEPSIGLREGLGRTYRWVYDKVRAGL